MLQKQSLSFAVSFFVVLLTYVNKIRRPTSYLEVIETVGGDSCLYKTKGPPQHPCLGDTGRILLGSLWHSASTTYGSSSALLNGLVFNTRSHQE